MMKSLKGVVIAVIGGDEREQEIARLAAKAGASVRAFGFPWPDEGIIEVTLADTAEIALKGAKIALMPIPGIATNGSLFATTPIIPRTPMLSQMAKGGHIILGAADDGLRKSADELGITIHEYESDKELMMLRAPAIVEGALQKIIEHTDVTIHNSKICVVGQGNIGTELARTLVLLGAQVTVAARSPVQRASAYCYGASPIPITDLREHAPRFDMLLSSVPARLVTKDILDQVKPGTLIMDLSAPPGGVDLDYARSLKLPAVWARGLGRRAPITVGASQWSGISRMIETILDEVRK